MRTSKINPVKLGIIAALSSAGSLHAAPAQKLEEVVVTAQKRAQNLQEVSTAVSAFSSERLDDAGVTDVQGLQYYAPSITIGNTFGYANLFIRGLGLNTVFANVDPSVTLYVDGAVISQPSAQLFSFYDLERVEVLRGPQGTLYGRNATGGTVNLIANKPSAELEGYFTATIGEYDQLDTEGAVGGALSDSVLGRIAFQSRNRSGYGKNTVTGNDVDDANRKAIRGQLLVNLSDSVNVLLTGEYGREDDAANAFLYKRETFPGSDNPRAIANGIGGFPARARNYASDVDPENDRSTASLTATLDWSINDKWSLKNIANYRDTEMINYQDLDASAIVNSTVQEFIFESEQFSEELQLTYTDDALKAIVGFYYFKEDLYHGNYIGVVKKGGSFTSPSGDAEKRVNLSGEGETESYAIFWNASYDLSEDFTLKLGGRFTEDERSIVNDNVIWAGPTRLSPANGNLPLFKDDGSFDDYTSEAGLEWRVTEEAMVYYNYSEGFKAGTGQLGANAADIIEPETISNHELGLKSTWLENTLSLNVAAYAYEVDNIQLDRTLVGGPTGFRTVFENATTQDARGVEIELFWAASDVFRVNASVSFQDTEFGAFLSTDPTNVANVPPVDPAAPFRPVTVDIKGNAARQAPELALNLHGEYDFPLTGGALITLIADVSFKDEHYFSEFNNALMYQDAYTIVDLRLKYVSADRKWTAALWAKNLNDELVEAGNYALASGRVVTRTFLPPRTSGITVRYDF